jgi:hypothetical protein
MANYFVHLGFEIPASPGDTDRFIQLIEAITCLQNGENALLAPEIEPAFRSDTPTAESVLVDIISDLDFGIECRFDPDRGTMLIWDNDGSPHLWALAQCLQRLYPDQLPLGFVYSETCDKPRANGFGGGYFAISKDSIINRSLAQSLSDEMAELGGPCDAAD